MYKNFVCVTDRKISRAPFLQQIETICTLRPKALILREKDLTEAEYTQLAQKVESLLEYYPARDRDLIADRICETVLVRQKCR